MMGKEIFYKNFHKCYNHHDVLLHDGGRVDARPRDQHDLRLAPVILLHDGGRTEVVDDRGCSLGSWLFSNSVPVVFTQKLPRPTSFRYGDL